MKEGADPRGGSAPGVLDAAPYWKRFLIVKPHSSGSTNVS